MSYCTKCGNQMEENARFCNRCGAAVEAAAADSFYTQSVPVMDAEPVVSVKDKVLGFVGMGLGISGLFIAVLGLLYTLIGMLETGVALGMAIAFGMFSFPLGFVGRALSKKSAEGGNLSRACSVGSALALAAIIVSFVMLFLGIINVAV